MSAGCGRTDRPDSGFTLLQDMVMLVVIGLLAGISVTAASDVRARAGYAALRSELERVAELQEAYREARVDPRDGPRYANLSQLRDQMGFTPGPDIIVRIRPGANGWSARARHARLPRRSQCALFMGSGSRPFPPSTTAGVLSCR